MSALKPVAGLTSGLLARKGAARPAMRSQLFASLRATPAPASEGPDLDDLGWNDMGDDTCPPSPSTDPDAAVARLAALVVAAGGGVTAAAAQPISVRDKVALTTVERLARGGVR